MTMTFRGFYRDAARRSIRFAWELGYQAHAAIGVIAGAIVLIGWGIGEYTLILVPFLALALAFVSGMIWFAYDIYRDESTESGEREAGLKEEISRRTASADLEDRRALAHAALGKLEQDLGELITSAKQTRPNEGPAHRLPTIQREHAERMKNSLADWLRRARKEAAKVSLRGYLASLAELEAAGPDYHELVKIAQRQAEAVNAILKKLG
jgi:hypothetical protein